MGIHIIRPGADKLVIKPFSKTAHTQTVQLWCNMAANLGNLELRRSVRSKARTEHFIIEFGLTDFSALAKTGNSALRAFAQQLKKRTTLSFAKQTLVMDAAMHQCIYRITHYAGSADAEALHAYAQVIELLALLQTNYNKAHTAAPLYIKNEYDRERILYARDYLLTHMDAPPALTQLAAIAGINEFKLKRGFKEMFSQSPFAYLADVRLEMARTALQKKEKSITQIAFELGYASLQHFSMAFRKKFGVAPRTI
jgi:AraC-like DNA-binding protein